MKAQKHACFHVNFPFRLVPSPLLHHNSKEVIANVLNYSDLYLANCISCCPGDFISISREGKPKSDGGRHDHYEANDYDHIEFRTGRFHVSVKIKGL